jgi:hypothetical protein
MFLASKPMFFYFVAKISPMYHLKSCPTTPLTTLKKISAIDFVKILAIEVGCNKEVARHQRLLFT